MWANKKGKAREINHPELRGIRGVELSNTGITGAVATQTLIAILGPFKDGNILGATVSCGQMLCETCTGLAVLAAEAASERRVLMEWQETLEARGETRGDREMLALDAADEKRKTALRKFLEHRDTQHSDDSRRDSDRLFSLVSLSNR